MKTQSNPANETLKEYICDGTAPDVVALYASLPGIARDADFGPFSSNVVVVDTETTGLSFSKDELIQIAAARMEGGQIADWYVTFVNPGREIPEDIMHLTGISNEDVADAPSPGEALRGLVEFAGDATMVAHNAPFDKHFCTRHVEGYPLWENLWVDSLDLARIALPRLRGHRLLDLVRAFDAPVSTHRADDDVAATCAILKILLAGISVMPPELVCEIARMAPREEWSTVAVFEWFARQYGNAAHLNLKALRLERLKGVRVESRRDAGEFPDDGMESLQFPSASEISDAFEPDGLIGRLYSEYETRVEQQRMSLGVRDAFANGGNLIVEAGTGVGKSMAYLLPAALTARKNGICVGVATKTNALLDQLVYHELPALASQIPGLRYASLKGFAHYPCLNRISRLVDQGVRRSEDGKDEGHPAPALAAVLSYVNQTVYDDLDALKVNYRALPKRLIATNSRDCLRRKCPFFGTSCFVHGARRAAETADIVVTNHSLLFCDIVADGGLLPPIRHWVVDEAHNAETEARRAFSKAVSAEDILRTIRGLAVEESAKNIFVRAERRVIAGQTQQEEKLFYALEAKAKSAGVAFAQSATDFVKHMKDLLFFDPNKRAKSYEYVELWINDDIRRSETFGVLKGYGLACIEHAEKLTSACQDLVGYLENVDNASDIQREIASLAIWCKEFISSASLILREAPGEYVYSATLSKRKDHPVDKLEALLLNVGNELGETLYANAKSVVYASATLSVDGGFDAFERAVGLNQGGMNQAESLLLPSSFNYDENMTIYVPKDMPEPADSKYLSVLQDLLFEAHLAQQGSMLTLFTNRREMESCYDAVSERLKRATQGTDEELRIICQKWGVSVKGLRDDFLKDKSLSLFALKSFWEGFDAPGSTLRGVVIPKLPFAKPTDPLSCERADRDDAAWWHYVLPAAVIETKQAVGRLIRTANDKGIIILADKRLVTKRYGRTFLNSLPSKDVRIMTIREIVQELQQGR